MLWSSLQVTGLDDPHSIEEIEGNAGVASGGGRRVVVAVVVVVVVEASELDA